MDTFHKLNHFANAMTVMVACGSIESPHQLDECGHSVNTACRVGLTLLAVGHGNLQTALLVRLIHLGAASRLARRGTCTTLHVAAGNGHYYTVRVMLKAGYPVDALSNSGGSVLHFAAGGGNDKVVKELLSTGCNINAIDNAGASPLHWAAEHGRPKAVSELISHGAKHDIFAGEVDTLLRQAAHCRVSTVKVLLKAGCRTDVVDSGGHSVLHCAAKNGNAEMITVLMNAECDVHIVESRGMTPLHYAAGVGNIETVLELIRHGAKKATVAGVNGIPLHIAASNCHPAMVAALLEIGCPVDVKTSTGNGVLHVAVFGGDPRVISMLLHRGCNVNATGGNGITPLDCAAMKGNTQAVLKLVRYGANKTTYGGITGGPLLAAAACGRWPTVQVMLEERFPVDGAAGDGKTMLHYAVIGSKVSLLCQLAILLSSPHPIFYVSLSHDSNYLELPFRCSLSWQQNLL